MDWIACEKFGGSVKPPKADGKLAEQDRNEAQPPSICTPRRIVDLPRFKGVDFTTIKSLGKGSEGKTALVKHKTKPLLYALKTVIKPDLIDKVPHEVAVLQALNLNQECHPHLIHVAAFSYVTDLAIPYVEYYLPYYHLGDLHSLTRRYTSRKVFMPELFVWKVFHQLASALEYLHRGFYDKRSNANPGLVHRDIKPENILLRAAPLPFSHLSALNNSGLIPFPEIVVSDFGHATFTEFTYEPCGTNIFHGPEIPRSSPKSDVWSMGAVIHTMIHSYPPIGVLPEYIPSTEENHHIWESRPEARQPNLRLPKDYSQDLARLMGFTMLEEGRRPYAQFIRRQAGRAEANFRQKIGKKMEGLERWGFAA